MLASAAIAPLNHLLRGESWARKRLQLFAGKTAHLCVPPFPDLAVTVQANGEVAAAANGATADATLTLAPGLLPRLLAHDEDACREIQISGDNIFAEEILHIGKNLHWDVEQDLSRITGDVLAHRIVQTGDSLLQWHTATIHNLSQTLAEYWTEEQPLLAKPAYVRKFIDDVDALCAETEQLEKRVEQLSKRASL